jgi:hypothetical protein
LQCILQNILEAPYINTYIYGHILEPDAPILINLNILVPLYRAAMTPSMPTNPAKLAATAPVGRGAAACDSELGAADPADADPVAVVFKVVAVLVDADPVAVVSKAAAVPVAVVPEAAAVPVDVLPGLLVSVASLVVVAAAVAAAIPGEHCPVGINPGMDCANWLGISVLWTSYQVLTALAQLLKPLLTSGGRLEYQPLQSPSVARMVGIADSTADSRDVGSAGTPSRRDSREDSAAGASEG